MGTTIKKTLKLERRMRRLSRMTQTWKKKERKERVKKVKRRSIKKEGTLSDLFLRITRLSWKTTPSLLLKTSRKKRTPLFNNLRSLDLLPRN
jgi:hypothetical protein